MIAVCGVWDQDGREVPGFLPFVAIQATIVTLIKMGAGVSVRLAMPTPTTFLLVATSAMVSLFLFYYYIFY